MHTPSQYARIAVSWLLSFVRNRPEPSHYPIETRRQTGVPADSAWFARVLNWPGPSGLGATEIEARAALDKVLREIAADRWSKGEAMPRPGSKVSIRFASTERVSSEPELLDDFIVRALGFARDPFIFISDETSIQDFGDEDETNRIRGRIAQHYGVVLQTSDSMLVADILVRIRARR